MNIKGILEIEGVTLHVDIEAPDGQEQIYVTNIHPNCLVVPKERWRVDYLGLSVGVLKELRQKKIEYLNQLVNGFWQLKPDGLSKRANQEITGAFEYFRKIALVFEEPSKEELEKAKVINFPIKEVEARALSVKKEEVPQKEPLSMLSLTDIKLPIHLITLFEENYQVNDVDGLIKLGRSRIIMTPGISSEDVDLIEQKLKKVGHSFFDQSGSQDKKEKDSVADLTAEHLTGEGLSPAL